MWHIKGVFSCMVRWSIDIKKLQYRPGLSSTLDSLYDYLNSITHVCIHSS